MSSSSGPRFGALGPTAMVGLAFALIGAGFGAIGLKVGGPFIGAAVASLGAAAIVGGIHSVVTRRHRTADGFQSSYFVRIHRGLAAVLFGVAFVIPGVIMVVGGLVQAFGAGEELWAGLYAHPGEAVMVAGVWACLGGLGQLLSRWSYTDVPTSWWERVPGQVLGLVILVLGATTIAAGWSLAADPEGPASAFARMVEWVAGILAGASER